MTTTAEKQKRTNALINLLQDDDGAVASMAMEQLLNQEGLDALIATLQDSANPTLRQRIHQISNIITRRRLRRSLLERIATDDITLWEAFRDINVYTDTQRSVSHIDELFEEINRPFKRRRANTLQIISYLRECGFHANNEGSAKIEHYNIAEVLEYRSGAALTLAVIAQKLGNASGWNATIGLHAGKYCLIDANFHMIDIAADWQISRVEQGKYHVCARRDLINCLLCSLVVAANNEGLLRDFYLYSKLFADINGIDLKAAGPPFGKK
ncbi:MAG TPA: transglutaminase family protein [Lentisphaeria bacterium]|nr:transglutaminase family protein [Lentisphaeria bacterium]